MGVYLNLKKNNEKICLGLSYHYKIDGELGLCEDDIYDEINYELGKIKTQLSSFAAYSPKSVDDLRDITEEVDNYVDYIDEKLRQIGRAEVIAELIENGFETIEE